MMAVREERVRQSAGICTESDASEAKALIVGGGKALI
jgi:hypothetical protein